ncbi:glycosyltransferase family 39 protein [Candidatus Omnitrophota bacterium]
MSLFVFNARDMRLTQDEGTYSQKAIIKVYEIQGVTDKREWFAKYFENTDMAIKIYGYNIYTYILTGFYYLFGYQVQAARFVNSLINILVFLLIFYLAKEVFNSRVAKISSAIFAFLPSITLWSAMLCADLTILLGITAFLYSLVKAVKKFDLRWLLLMVPAYYIVSSIRAYVGILLVVVAALTLTLKLFLRITPRSRVLLTVLAFMLLFLAMNPPVITFTKTKIEQEMHTVITQQRLLSIADDGGYLIYPLHCYKDGKCGILDLCVAYAKGMSYVLFSPFPWRIESKIQLMALPQNILWYFMIPFILYGFYRGYKLSRLATIAIFLYVCFMFSTFALAEGNMGALFRHKDMVMPFLLIYFAGAVDGLTKHQDKSK